MPVEAKKVSALAIDFGRNEIFIASGDKTYRSADNGKNWEIFNLLFGNREVSIISLIDDKLVIGSRKSNDLFFSLLKSL
ncbi:MAG: hypothetical protein NTW60_02045 [Candidatus Wolfebacteria bacterium]|nr:hypothetical protein [Candidatus Wolfebacteria bacterium]